MNGIYSITQAIANGMQAALRGAVAPANDALSLTMPAQRFRPESNALCSGHWNRVYIIQEQVSRWE